MKLVAMASCSNCVLLLAVVSILGSSLAMSEPLAMELSSVTATGARTRKVVEHAAIFQLKPNVSDAVKESILQSFADLKENSPKWVVAESSGLVLQPSQLEGESIGLFLRFFSKADLKDFFASQPAIATHEKYIIPYTTNITRISYVGEVEDNNEAVYRQGDAFRSGAERIVGIKVKNNTSQEDLDTMVKSITDLFDAPEFESLLVQITAGTNFNALDQQYTHGIVVRSPSLDALHTYSKHPHHISVISKTVWPIAESLFQVDYIVDGSGARKAFH